MRYLEKFPAHLYYLAHFTLPSYLRFLIASYSTTMETDAKGSNNFIVPMQFK